MSVQSIAEGVIDRLFALDLFDKETDVCEPTNGSEYLLAEALFSVAKKGSLKTLFFGENQNPLLAKKAAAEDFDSPIQMYLYLLENPQPFVDREFLD